MTIMAEAELSKSDIDRLGLCHQQRYRSYWPLFFAETALERRPARNLCSTCPVRLECLRWSLENKEIWGIWGGCDEAELRRALWVDSNGEPTSRCRFPHCPACKARPGKLYVVSTCELTTTRRRDQVECSSCGFTWKAATSVTAVKAYWRDRNRQLKAKVARGRLPGRPAKQLPPSSPMSVPEVLSITSLAASAAPPTGPLL